MAVMAVIIVQAGDTGAFVYLVLAQRDTVLDREVRTLPVMKAVQLQVSN